MYNLVTMLASQSTITLTGKPQRENESIAGLKTKTTAPLLTALAPTCQVGKKIFDRWCINTYKISMPIYVIKQKFSIGVIRPGLPFIFNKTFQGVSVSLESLLKNNAKLSKKWTKKI